MPTFGQFETVAASLETSTKAVYDARRDGKGEPAFMVKTLCRQYWVGSDEGFNDEAKSFLSAHRVQQDLAKAFPDSFTTIHDLNRSGDDPYCVMDRAPRTAAWIFDTKQTLTSRTLVRLVTALATALKHIRAGQITKAHGNIKTTNILLSSTDLESAQFRLTDPADPARLHRNAADDDLKAVGRILFELVTNREAPDAGEITREQSWASRGKRGEALRQLCSDLINPGAGNQLDPDKTIARAAAILKLPEGGGIPMAAIAAVLAVVLGGGGFAAYKFFGPGVPPLPIPVPVPVVKDVRTEEFKSAIDSSLERAAKLLFQSGKDRFKDLGPAAADKLKEFEREYTEYTNNWPLLKGKRPVDAIEAETINSEAQALSTKVLAFPVTIEQTLDRLELTRDITAVTKAIDEADKDSIAPIATDLAKVPADKQQAATEQATGITTDLAALRAAVAAVSTALPTATDLKALADLKASLAAAAKMREDLINRADAWQGNFNAARAALFDQIKKDKDELDAAAPANAHAMFTRARDRFFSYAKAQAGRTYTPEEYQAHLAKFKAWMKSAQDLAALTILVNGKTLFKPDLLTTLAQIITSRELTAMRNRLDDSAAIATIVGGASLGDLDFTPAHTRITAEFTAIGQAITDALTLDSLLANAFTLDEPASTGNTTLTALRAQIEKHPALTWLDATAADLEKTETGDPSSLRELATTLRAAAARAAEVESINAMTADTALIARIPSAVAGGRAAPPNSSPSSVRTAWNRLLALKFPAAASQLSEFQTIRTDVAKVFDTVPDAARRPALQRSLADSYHAAYIDFLNARLDTAPASSQIAFSLPNLATLDLGGTLEEIDPKLTPSLSPAARINRALVRLSTQLISPPPGINDPRALNTALGQLLDTNLKAIENDPALTLATSTPEFQQLASKFARPRAGGGFVNLASEGPGKRGWAATILDNDTLTRVRYTVPNDKIWLPRRKDAKATELEFVKLSISTDDAAYYLCTTELSLDAFLSVLELSDESLFGASGQNRPNFRSRRIVIPPYTGGSANDPRSGPRIWGWTKSGTIMDATINDEGNPTNFWLPKVPSSDRLAAFYAPGATIKPPSNDHPMNYISCDAAMFIAQLAGCRLPTEAEWQSAVRQSPQADSNLRDQTWKTQFDAIRSNMDAAGITQPNQKKLIPSAGAFASAIEDDTPAVTNNDGELWFRTVADGGTSNIAGLQVHHLVGNVAEFICNERWEAASSTRSVKEVQDFINAKRANLGVIGGSALSPKTVNPNALTPPPADDNKFSSEGYSDVGMRLAFSTGGGGGGGGGGGPYASALAILQKVSYLKPMPAAK